MALLLAACAVNTGPSHSPDDPEIRAAREDAQDRVAFVRSQLELSDRVLVLGDDVTDDCGTVENWWFKNEDLGYRCWMTWTQIAVIPDARTMQESAAIIDEELAGDEVPYVPGSMVRDLMSHYPGQREIAAHMPITGGGAEANLSFRVTAEAFRPAFWRGTVVDGDEIDATGANQTIQFQILIEYVNTEGLVDDDGGQSIEPVRIVRWAYGDADAIEIADWSPATAPDACLADPAVDQPSILRTTEPFPYLYFEYKSDDESDLDRILDCLDAGLTAGTVVSLTPDG
ncbi:hypothetical protein [Microbacterium tumbae]